MLELKEQIKEERFSKLRDRGEREAEKEERGSVLANFNWV